MMNKRTMIILLIVISICLASCSFRSPKLKTQLSELKESSAIKDEQIRRLQDLLLDKEHQLAEKEAIIKGLNKKLEGFGVFQ